MDLYKEAGSPIVHGLILEEQHDIPHQGEGWWKWTPQQLFQAVLYLILPTVTQSIQKGEARKGLPDRSLLYI